MSDEASRQASDSQPHPISRDEARRHALAGDIASLRRMGSQVSAGYAAASRAARGHGSDLSHLRRLLATTPGREGVELLLGLLGEQEAATGPAGLELPLMATMLAQHQSAPVLAQTVFADVPDDDRLGELRICLFHELLLRGVDPDEFPALRPASRLHPLSWLPDRRRPLETAPDFTSHSVNGSAKGVRTGLPPHGRQDPPTPRPLQASPLRNCATVGEHDLIVTAVEGNWGYGEAWVFRPDRPIAPDHVPALLPTLPMDCVTDLGPTGRFEIAARPVGDIWSLLFATASMGGFYGTGRYGAWGRLQAWRSLAGLSGAPFGAAAAEVELRAEQCTWFHFETDSEFFHNEGADYAVAALSPDGRRLAVLAATDTD
ncbi:DUF6183 family protein [Streptomyces sp. A0592]|uniref:DUF6183 family protein n=1 Tax=Streptomyces sp. A0592 TaxID=2563099 RepID=UPI00109E9E7E|nr:DUF6183 family protein [Streptomyces sp. A0592]THA80125.1 hypothetical protein E6U81_30470 [Streptomyces sp. A0592]